MYKMVFCYQVMVFLFIKYVFGMLLPLNPGKGYTIFKQWCVSPDIHLCQQHMLLESRIVLYDKLDNQEFKICR